MHSVMHLSATFLKNKYLLTALNSWGGESVSVWWWRREERVHLLTVISYRLLFYWMYFLMILCVHSEACVCVKQAFTVCALTRMSSKLWHTNLSQTPGLKHTHPFPAQHYRRQLETSVGFLHTPKTFIHSFTSQLLLLLSHKLLLDVYVIQQPICA